jgi:hypothetical protein
MTDSRSSAASDPPTITTDTKGNAMKIVTLNEAMDAAPEDVRAYRARADEQFGAGLFDKAVAHHNNLRLRANISNGTTQDKHGQKSKYIDYNWAHVYEDAPHLIWHDFFSGTIMNSCSRMARGLKP